jgi:trans-aconitate 2-methyltransferase
MVWDPHQYLAFAGHRLRPALDLLARIPDKGQKRIVDLGCGPGTVTTFLTDRWPDADVLGLDSSEEMLAKAGEAAPKARFEVADIGEWAPSEPVDLIYTNAALHWLPDHQDLFPTLFSHLKPGGTLAVQIPRNFSRPSHISVAEAAKDGPWEAKLAPMIKPPPTHAPNIYYDILDPLTDDLDIWETDYIQVLDGENPVAEWTKGTWLRPFLDALDEPDKSDFEEAYRKRIAAAYPKQANGKTLLPFLRLFIIAGKPE